MSPATLHRRLGYGREWLMEIEGMRVRGSYASMQEVLLDLATATRITLSARLHREEAAMIEPSRYSALAFIVSDGYDAAQLDGIALGTEEALRVAGGEDPAAVLASPAMASGIAGAVRLVVRSLPEAELLEERA